MLIESANQAQPFLDRMGKVMAGMGVPAVAGKVMGWLLISEPACQTPEEVARAVQAEPTAITPLLETLDGWGMLERVAMPGEATCYTIKSFHEMAQQRTALMGELREAADEGLALLKDQGPETRERLTEFRDLYAIMEQEMPKILARWEQQRTRR